MTTEVPTQTHVQPGSNKRAYIQTLNLKRLGHLERAACLAELIEELGGEVDTIINQGRSNDQGDDDKIENREAVRVDGNPDRRFKGNETEALSKARHMEGGDDGRGEVKDPEHDLRLKENLGKRAELAKK